MSDREIGILGTGRAIGSCVQTNEELCRNHLPDVSPDWIVAKTGILRRNLIAPDESAGSLSLAASRAALDAAAVPPAMVDQTVVSTFSGDYVFPPLSARLHRDLGMSGGQFYDLQANCVGFVSAVTAVADRMVRDPEVRAGLVVGTEVLSPHTDMRDVETAIFFSDGAGAVVLGPVDAGFGIRSSAFHADTSNFESVRLRGAAWRGPSKGPRLHADPERDPAFMEQHGLATWKQAVTHLPATIRAACAKAGWRPDEVDMYVFHQANLNLIEYLMKKLRVPSARTFTNVATVGNTGAASIPIALADAVSEGRLRAGDRVVLAGVGAGFGFGATCFVWSAGS